MSNPNGLLHDISFDLATWLVLLRFRLSEDARKDKVDASVVRFVPQSRIVRALTISNQTMHRKHMGWAWGIINTFAIILRVIT